MTSLGGKYLYPDNILDITVSDIARHLGRVVRFAGAVDTWWTVLHHSLLVADLVALDQVTGAFPETSRARARLAALFHDAHEFITGDVPSPWKTLALRGQQADIDVKIAAALNLPRFTEDELRAVKVADEIALRLECHEVAPVVAFVKPDVFGQASDVANLRSVIEPYLDFSPARALLATWYEDSKHVVEFTRRANGLLYTIGRA